MRIARLNIAGQISIRCQTRLEMKNMGNYYPDPLQVPTASDLREMAVIVDMLSRLSFPTDAQR
jgi:hypothetical protein